MAAGILASEETIYYAFHPLAGRIVSSSGPRVVRCGDVHLTIRLADGTLTLTPEWMLRPAAAGCEIRSAPRLCVARLRDLRAYLDAVLGSNDGDSPLTDGADHASERPTTGSIRRAAPPATDPGRNAAKRWWKACEALLTEALSQKVSTSIRKEATRHEPGRGYDHLAREAIVYVRAVDDRPGEQQRREPSTASMDLVERARRKLGWSQRQVSLMTISAVRAPASAAPGLRSFWRRSATAGSARWCRSRRRALARNGRDWHTLLEFCGLVGTLIADEDGVYDPRLFPNDRLLLGGMKGTMSEDGADHPAPARP